MAKRNDTICQQWTGKDEKESGRGLAKIAYCDSFCLKLKRKATKNSSHDSWSPGLTFELETSPIRSINISYFTVNFLVFSMPKPMKELQIGAHSPYLFISFLLSSLQNALFPKLLKATGWGPVMWLYSTGWKTFL